MACEWHYWVDYVGHQVSCPKGEISWATLGGQNGHFGCPPRTILGGLISSYRGHFFVSPRTTLCCPEVSFWEAHEDHFMWLVRALWVASDSHLGWLEWVNLGGQGGPL